MFWLYAWLGCAPNITHQNWKTWGFMGNFQFLRVDQLVVWVSVVICCFGSEPGEKCGPPSFILPFGFAPCFLWRGQGEGNFSAPPSRAKNRCGNWKLQAILGRRKIWNLMKFHFMTMGNIMMFHFLHICGVHFQMHFNLVSVFKLTDSFMQWGVIA